MMNQNVTPEQYTKRRELAVHTLLELPAAKNVTYSELSLEAEELMAVAQQEGWLQMEWFLNITPTNEIDEMEGIEVTHGNSLQSTAGKVRESKGAGSDYIGLGTMLQDATDYLSERRREDYIIWKAKIMDRVEEIEASA